MTKRLKLHPSVKKKWLEALRSGEYKQTTGRLRNKNPDSFCCLGVLCNIHAQEHPAFAKKQKSIYSYDGHTEVPSTRVLEWAFDDFDESFDNADIRVPHPTRKGCETSLASLNDDTRLNFKAIADVIEKQL